MIVEIPACAPHEGLYTVRVEIADTCPVCGGPRGTPYRTISFDGSRRLECDGWKNPCGHIDLYADVRKEGRSVSFTAVRDPESENPPITEEFSRAEELRLSSLADYYDEESQPWPFP